MTGVTSFKPPASVLEKLEQQAAAEGVTVQELFERTLADTPDRPAPDPARAPAPPVAPVPDGDVQIQLPVHHTAPATSQEAALSTTVERTRRQQAVYAILEIFPDGLTDEQLERQYRWAVKRLGQHRFPEQSVSGLRTRRSELVDQGLVRDTGRRRKTEAGRPSIVWAVRRKA